MSASRLNMPANARVRTAVRNVLAIAALAFLWEVSAWIAAARGSNEAALAPTWQTIISHSVPSFAVFASGSLTGNQHNWGLALQTLVNACGISALRVIVSLVLGAVIGIGVGLTIGSNKAIRALLYPTFRLLRNVPLLALIPLFLIWFGTSDEGIIIFITFGLGIIYLTGTVEGLANVSRVRVAFAQTLGARRREVMKDVMLPSIVPNLLDATRVAVGVAFAVGLGGELIAEQSGLGHLLLASEQFLATGRMVIVCVCYATMTGILAAGVELVSLRLTAWVPSRSGQTSTSRGRERRDSMNS